MNNSKVNKETKDRIIEAFDSITEEETKVPSFYSKVLNFQGKKSFMVAKKLIERLVSNNGIVYDPFFGTGSFLIGAALANKKVVGTELDNYVYNAVKTLLSKIDIKKLEDFFKQIENTVKLKVLDLYTTTCCGKENYIKKLHFDPETSEYREPTPHRDILNGKNIKLLHKCTVCKSSDKRFDDLDMQKLHQINKLDYSRFPTHHFIENSRINITSATGADKYDTNFANRSKLSLLWIQDAINSLPDTAERDVLEYALIFSIALSKIAMYGSGTNNLYHVIRNSAQEMNVWVLFEEKFKHIKNYKKELSAILQTDFSEKSVIEIHNCDYASFLTNSNIKFDVIYTDPPYTDQVPYLEYQQYYRDWLKLFYNKDKYELLSSMLEKEIVVTNAPSRTEKDLENYYKDLDLMFHRFANHLDRDGLLFLTIKLGEKKYFSVLTKYIEFAKKHGLEFVHKYSITNNDPTIRKQAAYINTISTQIVICFQKLDDSMRYWYIDNDNIDKMIVENSYNLIANCENQYILLPELVSTFKNLIFSKYYHTVNEDELRRINNTIKENFFVDSNANVRIDPNMFYVGLEDKKSLFIKLYDIVPVLIKKLLDANGKFTLDDLYYEIANLLCDYDQTLFDVFLQNEKYKSSINALLDNYCEKSHNVYIQRKIQNKQTEGSVDISCLDGYQFEDVIKRVLSKIGYANVLRMGGAGDRGVDLIATNKTTGEREIFQCKRWISNVGSEPIQRLHSMMTIDSKVIKKATCITTSDYTSEGKEIARLTGVITINGLKLLDILEKFFPNEYYHGALTVKI